MLAEGLIHLRFMSPYTLFFINKKQGLCAEGRFTPPNFTVCIMQYAEVLRQKVLKQREIFFLRKSNLGILFSNNEWEANWVTQKMLFRECFQWWSKLHHAHIWLALGFFYSRKSYSEHSDFPLEHLSGYPFSLVSSQSREGSAICSKAGLHLSLSFCLSWILIFLQDLKKFLMLKRYSCWSFLCYLLFIIVAQTLCQTEVLTGNVITKSKFSESSGSSCFHWKQLAKASLED